MRGCAAMQNTRRVPIKLPAVPYELHSFNVPYAVSQIVSPFFILNFSRAPTNGVRLAPRGEAIDYRRRIGMEVVINAPLICLSSESVKIRRANERRFFCTYARGNCERITADWPRFSIVFSCRPGVYAGLTGVSHFDRARYLRYR